MYPAYILINCWIDQRGHYSSLAQHTTNNVNGNVLRFHRRYLQIWNNCSEIDQIIELIFISNKTERVNIYDIIHKQVIVSLSTLVDIPSDGLNVVKMNPVLYMFCISV